jgi:hypothetical protein
MCDIICVTGLSKVMLNKIHANAVEFQESYASTALVVS